MNKYRKVNLKIVALIVEIVLMLLTVAIVLIFDSINKPINMIPIIVIIGVLLFCLILTLSLIRYDAMRDILSSDVFKDNIPLFTDQETLICHDLKDESEKERDNK